MGRHSDETSKESTPIDSYPPETRVQRRPRLGQAHRNVRGRIRRVMMPRGRINLKAKRAQLELATVAHLALDFRQRRHARIEIISRNDARRIVELPLDIRERPRGGGSGSGRRRPTAKSALFL